MDRMSPRKQFTKPFSTLSLSMINEPIRYSSLLPPANEVWGKVIFLHLFLILFRGEYLGRYPPGPGTPPGTRYTPPPDQVHPPRTRYPPGRYTPSEAVHAGRYGQQAGGTHPTGMQSCICYQIELILPSILEATKRQHKNSVIKTSNERFSIWWLVFTTVLGGDSSWCDKKTSRIEFNA